MSFPLWICINCGKPSNRKYNIQRHIRIRHNGIGAFVSFTDYLVGRQTGMYQPSSAPTYHSRTNSLDIFMEEAHRELARKLVNQNFSLGSTWNQNQYGNSSAGSSNSSTSNAQPSTIDSNDIIGYRGHVCKNCLEANIEEIHLAAFNGKEIVERKHVCEPKKLAESYLYNNTDKNFRDKNSSEKSH